MNFVIEKLVGPTVRRAGTLAGGWLVGLGMSAPAAQQVEVALVALALFGIDLVSSNLNVLGKR